MQIRKTFRLHPLGIAGQYRERHPSLKTAFWKKNFSIALSERTNVYSKCPRTRKRHMREGEERERKEGRKRERFILKP
jgi:hypothetical protein